MRGNSVKERVSLLRALAAVSYAREEKKYLLCVKITMKEENKEGFEWNGRRKKTSCETTDPLNPPKAISQREKEKDTRDTTTAGRKRHRTIYRFVFAFL